MKPLIGMLALGCLALQGGPAYPLSGLSANEFDPEGRLIRRLVAEEGVGSPSISSLKGVKVEFFTPGFPDKPVALLTVPVAEYNAATSTMRGEGALDYRSPEGNVRGRGFIFNFNTGVLTLESDVRFESPLVTLTGTRATVQSDTNRRAADPVKWIEVRDKVVALRGPEAETSNPERLETEFARYETQPSTLSVSPPLRTWRDGRMSVSDVKSGDFVYPIERSRKK